MILLALKSLFFMTAIFGYSTGVWRLINNYFQQEFTTYLDEEVKKNKFLLVDPVKNPPAPGSSTVEIVTEREVKQARGSVTSNRMLDELIVSFGRLFTTRNEPEFSRTKNAEINLELPAKEIIATVPRIVLKESIPDPDPGKVAVGRGTIIESDKFPRSSSSEEDNKSDEDDDANDDDEEKWIKYWKNREREQSLTNSAVEDGASGGHCAAEMDACGP